MIHFRDECHVVGRVAALDHHLEWLLSSEVSDQRPFLSIAKLERFV